METSFAENRSFRPYDGTQADPIAVLETDLDRLERFMGEFREEDIWVRPAPGTNSLGNLILHVCGSLNDWLGQAILGKTIVRDRDAELSQTSGPLEELMGAFQEARSLLRELRQKEMPMDASVLFRGKQREVGYLIYQQLEHVAYHTGQAAMLRQLVGKLKPNYP